MSCGAVLQRTPLGEGLLVVKWRQQARNGTRQKSLAGSRWPNHEQVVSAGKCDLQDLVVDGRNANVLRNEGTVDGITTFRDTGPVAGRVLAGHSTCPTVVGESIETVRGAVIAPRKLAVASGPLGMVALQFPNAR